MRRGSIHDRGRQERLYWNGVHGGSDGSQWKHKPRRGYVRGVCYWHLLRAVGAERVLQLRGGVPGQP